MGYTATWAGLVSAPTGVVAFVAAPLVGRLKWDPRVVGSLAFVSFAASFWMRSNYTPDASFWALTVPLFIQGIAFATLFVPLTAITLDGVPPEKMPSAAGLSNFARITAGSFAASIVTTYWDRREALHQSRLVEAVTETAPAYRQALERLQSLSDFERRALLLLRLGRDRPYRHRLARAPPETTSGPRCRGRGLTAPDTSSEKTRCGSSFLLPARERRILSPSPQNKNGHVPAFIDGPAAWIGKSASPHTRRASRASWRDTAAAIAGGLSL
jgi:hypothetical protein